eukprot:14658430-Heterocapsa_arctica.AAC.1
MGAHCVVPGHGQCRLNRAMGKLPLAFLAEWLRRGQDFPNRAEHFELRLKVNPGQALGVEARFAARALVQADAGLAGARALEDVHRSPAEPLEPRTVR